MILQSNYVYDDYILRGPPFNLSLSRQTFLWHNTSKIRLLFFTLQKFFKFYKHFLLKSVGSDDLLFFLIFQVNILFFSIKFGTKSKVVFP